MAELTVKKIIEIHDEIIRRYSGARGVLSEATLEMLVYKLNYEKDVLSQNNRDMDKRKSRRTTSGLIS